MSESRTQDLMVEMIKSGGCFVSTRVGMFRATKALSAEELGLADIPRGLMSAGRINLLPEQVCPDIELLKKIENSVGALIQINTFKFEGFGNYLQNSKTEEFSAQMAELKEDYDGEVQAFLQNYESYIEDSVDFWEVEAKKIGIQSSNIRSVVREAFPSITAVRKKFKFVVTYLRLPSPATEAWKNCEAEYTGMSSDFLAETMQQIRNEAFNSLQSMGESLSTGKWNQRTLSKIPKILDRISEMALIEDDELYGAIDKFRNEFITASAKDIKSDESEVAFNALRDGLSDTISIVSELAQKDMDEVLARNFGEGKRKLSF